MNQGDIHNLDFQLHLVPNEISTIKGVTWHWKRVRIE